MDCKKWLITTVMLMIGFVSAAQLRLPAFDISLKTGYMFMPDDYYVEQADGNRFVSYQYESIWAQGEVNVHIGQRIAVGFFYNKSLLGGYVNHDGDQPAQEAEHLLYGVLLRLSSGRAVKVRPYLQVKYFKNEVVVHQLGYDVANQCTGAAAGLGLMIRLSNKLYLNIPDVELGSLFNSGDILFRDKSMILKAGLGLTYNFSRRK